MTPNFDPNAYWIERGFGYRDEKRLQSEFYRDQESFVCDIVADLNVSTLVEVGCGYGRITRVLAERFPALQITAVDLSYAQIHHAREHCAGLGNVRLRQHDLCSDDDSLPQGHADLAIAIEVFLHHPAASVSKFLRKMLAVSPLVLHDVDLSVHPGDPTAEHCFAHDYAAIYKSISCEVAGSFERGQHAFTLVRFAS